MMNVDVRQLNREIVEIILRTFCVTDWYCGQFFSDRADDTVTNFIATLYELSEVYPKYTIGQVAQNLTDTYEAIKEDMYNGCLADCEG